MKLAVAVAFSLTLAGAARAEAPPPAATTPPVAAKPGEQASNFRFAVPPGWSDRSPGDPNFYTVALDEKHKLVFQAKVQKGGAPATKELLEKYADDARRSLLHHLPDVKFEVIDRHLVPLAGTTAGRFVFEITPPGGKDAIKQLQFYLPAGGQQCIMTFTAPRETYAQLVPLFEATAAAVTIVPSKP